MKRDKCEIRKNARNVSQEIAFLASSSHQKRWNPHICGMENQFNKSKSGENWMILMALSPFQNMKL